MMFGIILLLGAMYLLFFVMAIAFFNFLTDIISLSFSDVWYVFIASLVLYLLLRRASREKKPFGNGTNQVVLFFHLSAMIITMSILFYFNFIEVPETLYERKPDFVVGVTLAVPLGVLFTILAYLNLLNALRDEAVQQYKNEASMQAILDTYEDGYVTIEKEVFDLGAEKFVEFGIFRTLNMQGLNDYTNNNKLRFYVHPKYEVMLLDVQDTL